MWEISFIRNIQNRQLQHTYRIFDESRTRKRLITKRRCSRFRKNSQNYIKRLELRQNKIPYNPATRQYDTGVNIYQLLKINIIYNI
jgi:hypothetical protein